MVWFGGLSYILVLCFSVSLLRDLMFANKLLCVLSNEWWTWNGIFGWHVLLYSFSLMQICYFFYKNIAFGFTLFWFEAYASFSGQPAYNDWYMSFYNVFFTSLPVIALGVFDQDVSARFCLKVQNYYPSLSLYVQYNNQQKPSKKRIQIRKRQVVALGWHVVYTIVIHSTMLLQHSTG
jgi:hypothetical protein